MSSEIETRIQTIGRRARNLRVLFAIARLVAIAAAVVLIVGTLDFVIRFQEHGVRVLLSACGAVAVAWSIARWLWPAVSEAPDPLQVARQIELSFPVLRDRLTSAVDFLRRPATDPWAGSAELRRAVVVETAGEIERINLAECLDARRVWRSVGLAALVCLVLAVACWLDIASATLALQRMAVPWAGPAWPRRHELMLVSLPERVVAGTDLEVQVTDRKGRLPDRVAIQYWYEGDTVAKQKRMRPLGDRMVDTLINVARSFRCRAIGGDDDTMPWYDVEVVDRTRLKSLTVVLHPPDYTARPTEQSRGDLRVLEGTEARLSATLSQPIVAAMLESDTADELVRTKLAVSPDGRSVSWPASDFTPWTITRSGTYSIRFTHRDGLISSSTRFTVESIPDAPPVVTLNAPLSAAYVTPSSVVLVKATVTDDIGIQQIALLYGPSGDEDELRRDVWSAENRDTAQHELIAEFDLAPLGAAVGSTVNLVVTAQDFKPGTGQSTVCQIHLISPDQLEDRLAQRRVSLLNQLAEALRIEREARTVVSGLRIDWSQTRQLTYPDLDRLQAAELNQRQVKRLLGSENQGALALVEALLAELQTNRIDHPETLRRAETIKRIVTRLGRRELAEIEHHLVDALGVLRELLPQVGDSADANRSILDRVAASLEAAEGGQQQVIETLETLLAELSIWDSYRRFARELNRLQDDQNDIAEDTNRLRRETIGRDASELQPAERAELERTAGRQRELARRFEKLQSRMEHMEDELSDADPDASALLRAALDAARQATVAGRMRESGRNIQDNQLGQAAAEQQDVSDGLDRVLDALDRRAPDTANRSVAMLAQRVTEILERETAVFQATGEFDLDRTPREPLTRTRAALVQEIGSMQRDLAIDTGELADQVSDRPPFQLALRMSVANMNRAADGLAQFATDVMVQDAQRSAVDRLRQILDALSSAAPPPTGDPPSNPSSNANQPGGSQLNAAELKLIRGLQQEINRRTEEIQRRRIANDGLSADEQLELDALAQQQGQLAQMIRNLVESVQRSQSDGKAPDDDSTGLESRSSDMMEPPAFHEELQR